MKPACHLFRMTSDAFFARHDPKAILGAPVDVAFLDGMHLFEYLLRDFMHVEQHCRPNSVIVLHDCLPTDVGMTRRVNPWTEADGPIRDSLAWTGDVWKVLPALRTYRPELRIHVFDAPPTGLVMVTGLDPASTVLRTRYFDIVEQFRDLDLVAIGLAAYTASQGPRSTRSLTTDIEFRRHFWL